MALDLRPFANVGLDEPLVRHLIADHHRRIVPELHWLWSYYRNPIEFRGGDRSEASRGYEVAQERGLPPRIRRIGRDAGRDDRASRPEPVIENDIAWRIDALVAFIFGKPIAIRSTAADPALRARIERSLEAVMESSGGMGLLQDAALLGNVHGWVDLVVRVEPLINAGWQLGSGAHLSDGALAEIARVARIETIEAPRGVPVLAENDYRRIDAYLVHATREGRAVIAPAPVGARGSLARWLAQSRSGHSERTTRIVHTVLEVLSAHHRQVYIDDALVEEHTNRLGVVPVVHIQNATQPFRYAGLSEVEPLVPLQDELNARLSDRAHRVTMQSFNMYLAKGLEALSDSASAMRIAPGQVWATDNPEADVKSFGGDGHSPSEERHIDEVREAMDKLSSVSPVVLGVVRAKLGHLSSVNALRITMLGVLAKTERKRLAYGRGIAEACRLVLRAMDIAGLLPTREEDRGIRIEWPDPLPASEEDRLAAARLKRDIGVPEERVLAELGYATRNAAVE